MVEGASFNRSSPSPARLAVGTFRCKQPTWASRGVLACGVAAAAAGIALYYRCAPSGNTGFRNWPTPGSGFVGNLWHTSFFRHQVRHDHRNHAVNTNIASGKDLAERRVCRKVISDSSILIRD